jgi:hypothetical protein
MAMKRKYIMFTLLFLASACLTMVCYMWLNKVDTAKDKLALSIKQNDITFQKYFNDDYDSAKVAMLSYIQLLDKFSAESKDPVRNPFACDATFWYVRLAKLEDKNNHSAEKIACMREALSRYKAIWGVTTSEENLHKEVTRMDEIALKAAK